MYVVHIPYAHGILYILNSRVAAESQNHGGRRRRVHGRPQDRAQVWEEARGVYLVFAFLSGFKFIIFAIYPMGVVVVKMLYHDGGLQMNNAETHLRAGRRVLAVG